MASHADIAECTKDCHAELLAEHGRAPSLAELHELTGIARNTLVKRCRAMGLALTDGRAVRYTGTRNEASTDTGRT